MRIFALIVCLVALLPAVAEAQRTPDEATLDAEVRRLASELRCPRCQGLSIADSPDDLAVQMNVVIRQQLEAGRTPEEVRAYFVSRYGEWVLLKPEPRGFNLVAYVVPILALFGGAGFLALRVRKWTRPSPAAGVGSEASGPSPPGSE